MHDVAVVGGGPVGLLAAILFVQQGRSVTVLERRTCPSAHSRAIGIHPPSLAVLQSAGVADELVRSGVQIARGNAFSGGRPVAGLDFSRASPEFPYILSVPQSHTEGVLEHRLAELSPGALRRGLEVEELHDDGSSVRIRARDSEGTRGIVETRARIAVAADGAHSAIRQNLESNTRFRRYPDFYVMGDFQDNTPFGQDAVLFLEPGGIVECFPLPGNIRRWVVRLGAQCPDPDAGRLAALIHERTAADVDAASNTMLSAFGVRSCLVRRMVHGRVALLGDAAHEISPIGGQGMNLGWLDAAALAPVLGHVLAGESCDAELAGFERSRRRTAKRAIRQAGLNMALGRPLPQGVLAARNTLFARLIGLPAAGNLVARRFTMH